MFFEHYFFTRGQISCVVLCYYPDSLVRVLEPGDKIGY